MNTKPISHIRAKNPVYNNEGHPWEADPRRSFQDWLLSAEDEDGRGFSEKTVRVYTSMWSTFVHTVKARRGRSVSAVQSEDVLDFLNHSRPCQREQARRRYQLLLDRAFRAMSSAGPVAWTPLPKEYKAVPKVPDKPMPFLTSEERQRLFEALGRLSSKDEEGFYEARSKALCALMLGAGFKPGQALYTSVNCVIDGPHRYLIIPAHGTQKEHRACVLPQAWPAIQSWLDELGSHEKFLFPGRLGSAKGPIDYARVYLGAKNILKQWGPMAGGERVSPQTLRNSYGATWIENGCTANTIREYMGFSRLEFARRFIESHAAWTRRMIQQGLIAP